MGLKAEFYEARDWCKDHLGNMLKRMGGGVSVFETTIRSLGGLLAAFELSKVKERGVPPCRLVSLVARENRQEHGSFIKKLLNVYDRTVATLGTR